MKTGCPLWIVQLRHNKHRTVFQKNFVTIFSKQANSFFLLFIYFNCLFIWASVSTFTVVMQMHKFHFYDFPHTKAALKDQIQVFWLTHEQNYSSDYEPSRKSESQRNHLKILKRHRFIIFHFPVKIPTMSLFG